MLYTECDTNLSLEADMLLLFSDIELVLLVCVPWDRKCIIDHYVTISLILGIDTFNT